MRHSHQISQKQIAEISGIHTNTRNRQEWDQLSRGSLVIARSKHSRCGNRPVESNQGQYTANDQACKGSSRMINKRWQELSRVHLQSIVPNKHQELMRCSLKTIDKSLPWVTQWNNQSKQTQVSHSSVKTRKLTSWESSFRKLASNSTCINSGSKKSGFMISCYWREMILLSCSFQ